jgi:hypothetical protein
MRKIVGWMGRDISVETTYGSQKRTLVVAQFSANWLKAASCKVLIYSSEKRVLVALFSTKWLKAVRIFWSIFFKYWVIHLYLKRLRTRVLHIRFFSGSRLSTKNKRDKQWIFK